MDMMPIGIPAQATGPSRQEQRGMREAFEEQVRSSGQGLDWIGFAFVQVGFRVYIEDLCGFLIFGDVW